MKNATWLIIAILLCNHLPANSQSSDFDSKRWTLGIIGGFNRADMLFPNHQSDEDQKTTVLTGFGTGIVLHIRLSENLFARVEPMYLQKGCHIEEGADPANQPEGQISSSAIEIPLLIQYTFGKKIQSYLIGGPTMAYNLKSEIEFNLTDMKFKGDLKAVTETFDLGFAFGGGFRVPIRFGRVFLEGRYIYGVINQKKSGITRVHSNDIQLDLPSDREQDKYFNRGFQLLAGVTLPLY